MADADVITPSDEQIDRLFVAASCILICLVKKTCATAGGTSQRVLHWFNQSGALTFNLLFFFTYLQIKVIYLLHSLAGRVVQRSEHSVDVICRK